MSSPQSPDKGHPARCQRSLGVRASGPPAGGTPALPGRPLPSCAQSLEKPLHGAPFNALQRFLDSLSEFVANRLIYKQFIFQ